MGQFRVIYRVKGAPKLLIEDGYYLLQLSKNGLLQTSSNMKFGLAVDEYYYLTKKGRRKIKSSGGWGEGNMI